MLQYSIRIAPVTRGEARHIITDQKAIPVLEKAAAGGSLYLDGLIDAILTVSRIAAELHSEIAALDINPLVCRAADAEIMALDAKIHLRAC
jgi:succinyl-CoA synthetase beta subunit